jgi:hypothetical protein
LEDINAYRVLVRKFHGNSTLGRREERGSRILKWATQKYVMKV